MEPQMREIDFPFAEEGKYSTVETAFELVKKEQGF